MTDVRSTPAWTEWRAAREGARMHHGWILAGRAGLGKRAFAMEAARDLVGATGEGDHPDILVLDHPPKDDKEARKKADGKPYERARNIKVDQIRAMQRMLTTRATLGDNRVVIIDPADDMEASASNALLKSLEEPPAGTTMILVAHRPARLLPTIRSRCRLLRFGPLDDDAIRTAVANASPETSVDLRDAAVRAAGGSPGMAMAYIEHDMGKVDRLLREIVTQGDADFTLRGALSAAIGARPDKDRQRVLFDLARAILTDRMAQTDREALSGLADAHADLVELAAQAPIYNFDANFLVMEIGSLLASVAGNRSGANV
ncbi:DNA polymerase III subunit delta' [Erythrobacteraceae bacterium WH01K]|nr:DNA polymerase III subunit delta' [Erythrobacteraceae bacterium WH01K]